MRIKKSTILKIAVEALALLFVVFVMLCRSHSKPWRDAALAVAFVGWSYATFRVGVVLSNLLSASSRSQLG